MTFQQLHQQKKFILLDCVSGSNAYNLNLPHSDIDRKGIFISPQKNLYGFGGPEQLTNATNDEVYYEVKRFLELLGKNNPNILELLNTPDNFVTYRHPLINLIKPENFLSKLCLDTFAGYAQTQIKKAKGLNKKINKPMDKQRKSVLDFCHVIYNNGSISLNKWLSDIGWDQRDCGLLNLPHFRNVYLLFHQSQLKEGYLRGIISGEEANDVQLSSIPRYIEPIATLNFNKDGYSIYCREYKEYQDWEVNRNNERYESTLGHGKN